MSRPRISLCMIVRDEEATLARCLASAAGAADELLVVDTGSRDGTPDLARAWGARVVHRPWQDDFAAARNAALELAGGEWILCLDADEELAPGAAGKIRSLVATGAAAAYLCQVVSLTGSRAAPDREISLGLRLFRNRPEHRFAGAVHEQLRLPPGARVVNGGFRIYHWGYLDEAVRDRRKLERNAALARRMVAADPQDPLPHFHLAVALYLQRRYGEAAGHCRQALDLRPDPAQPWVSTLVRTGVACLLAQERHEAALAELEHWLPVYPGFTDLVHMQGLALAALGRLPEALAAFRRCLELGPAPVPPYSGAQEGLGGAVARYMLGVVSGRLGDREGAEAALRQALQERPGWTAPLAALADLPGAAVPALLEAGAAAGLAPPAVAAALAAEHRYGAALACLEHAGAGADRPLAARCLWALGRAGEAASLLAGHGPEAYAAAAAAFLAAADAVLADACSRFPGWQPARQALERLPEVAGHG